MKLALISLLAAAGLAWLSVRVSSSGCGGSCAAPETLAATGLYEDVAHKVVGKDNLAYEPQYPLWSDGAAKKRWVHLPPHTRIDASDPAHWSFPTGTKFWKEFSFGRRVETRYMELTEGGRWIYATYIWKEDGSDAVLAPANGVRGIVEIGRGARHDIPGVYDCMACHEGQPNRVLGFSALQLSPDRDPLAPHARAPGPEDIDLRWLDEHRLLSGIPREIIAHPPRIDAPTPVARAALGYLHGNCGGCHNGGGPLAELGLSLEAPVGPDGKVEMRASDTAVGQASRFRPPSRPDEPALRIAPRDAAHSVLAQRISSRDPNLQMPPLGTHLVDSVAVALITRWIDDDMSVKALHPIQAMHTTQANRLKQHNPFTEEK